MKKCSFDIWYFLGIDKKGNTDGNSMTTQQRVDEALLLLVDIVKKKWFANYTNEI